LLIYLSPALAFFKVPCSTPLVIERADPLISPGVASNHVHAIIGGSGFGFTMNYEMAQKSQCNSCSAIKDKSNYLVAASTTMLRMEVSSKFHRTVKL
jgi:hypothetical protein